MIIIFPLQYICIHTNNNKNWIYLFSDINTVILLQYLYMHIYIRIYTNKERQNRIYLFRDVCTIIFPLQCIYIHIQNAKKDIPIQ